MTQRLIIRLIPLEIFFFSIVTGWLLMSGMRVILHTPSGLGSAGQLSPVFTPEVQHWARKITAWAALYQLDPNLVATVMQIESCGAPHAASSSGAQGLFQVMPYHFDSQDMMEDPDTNAGRGLAYLALGLSRAGGNIGLALAGYNGGHGVIGQDRSLWPAE